MFYGRHKNKTLFRQTFIQNLTKVTIFVFSSFLPFLLYQLNLNCKQKIKIKINKIANEFRKRKLAQFPYKNTFFPQQKYKKKIIFFMRGRHMQISTISFLLTNQNYFTFYLLSVETFFPFYFSFQISF